MNKGTEFKTDTFHGQKISYVVDGDGRFGAYIGDAMVSRWDNDLDRVERNAKAKARQNKVLVSVPFTHVTTDRWGARHDFNPVQATATGIHAGNDDILAETRAGEKLRVATYDARAALVPMSEAEMAEGRRLNDEARATAKAFDNWQKEHALDLQTAVHKAVAVAQGEVSE